MVFLAFPGTKKKMAREWQTAAPSLIGFRLDGHSPFLLALFANNTLTDGQGA
jgi:hypothetical protein